MECISLHEILGGKSVCDLKIGSRLDLMELSGKGLTKEQLLNLSQFLELPVAKIAELLPVSERTIARHKPDETFGRAVSEHILQIAETIACGMNVFENRENLIAWLNLPNHALGDKSPMSLLISRFGMEMVLNELVRIEHGVYA
jgi:putative toxin-antitoxin system antitoxin component (TIGR02293 family)